MTQPEDIATLFVEAWNERDAMKLSELFAEDAEFVNVVGLWWHNRADIYKAHDYGLKVIFKDSNLELRRTKVKYLTDEVAVVHARMRLSGQTQVSNVASPGLRQNIFSFVMKKLDGSWQCESAHNTDIIPGAETNVVDDGGKLKGADYRE